MLIDFLVNIPVICIFHYNTKNMLIKKRNLPQILRISVNKGVFVLNNIWMVNRSQNSNFINCIFNFFFAKLRQIYLFQRINFIIKFSSYFINLRICTISNLIQNFKIIFTADFLLFLLNIEILLI